MTAAALLNRCQADGVALLLDGGDIVVRGPAEARARLLPEILQHKAALVHLLLVEVVDEAVMERRAILELDGGHTGQSAAEVAELARAYYSHHWSCTACRTGTQVGALLHHPCPDGQALWDRYCEAAGRAP